MSEATSEPVGAAAPAAEAATSLLGAAQAAPAEPAAAAAPAQTDPAAPAETPAQEAAPAEPVEVTITLPEGSPVDTAVLDAYKATIKETGLTQAQADKLTPWLLEQQQAIYTQQVRQWADTTKGWHTEVTNDPEIGGAKLAANMSLAATALDKFASPALRQWFNETGIGNHPELVKAFVKIGAAMAEDRRAPDRGAPSRQAERSIETVASRFYPSMSS